MEQYIKYTEKLSVGTLTTSKYPEKTAVFEQLNDKVKDYASIVPQSNYFGQTQTLPRIHSIEGRLNS